MRLVLVALVLVLAAAPFTALASEPVFVYEGYLEPGTVIAWHGYRLVLNGSGYVEFSGVPVLGPEMSVVAVAKAYQHPDWQALVSRDELDWRLYVSAVSDRWDFSRRDSSGSTSVAEGGVAAIGVWETVAAVSTNTTLTLYVDGSQASASWSGSPAGLGHPLLIGVNSYNGSVMWAQAWIGEVRYVAVYSRALEAGEAAALDRALPSTGLVLLFDPSWYDGQGFDTPTGLRGTPVGSWSLERDSEWFYVLQGLTGDGLVFWYLPEGYWVRVLVGEEEVAFFESSGGVARIPWGGGFVRVEVYSSRPLSEGMGVQGLSYLFYVLMLFALFSPLLAWRLGLVGSAVSLLGVVMGAVLGVREYLVVSRAPGTTVDAAVLQGSLLLLVVLMIVDFGFLLYHLLRRMARTRRGWGPESPFLD